MKGPKGVLMLLSNDYRPDPRVQREAYGLVQRGYRLTVLCWDRRQERPAREGDRGVEIRRIQDLPSDYGRGWRQLIHIPRFWRRCIRQARQLKPAAVHCHDLDTLYAGWRIKEALGCPLIYDAHEHYPAMMSLYLPGVLVRALAVWERRLIRKVDATITASSVLQDAFAKAGISPVIALGNFAELAPFVEVDPTAVRERNAHLRGGRAALAVGYVGGFSRNRLLEPFLACASLRPDVQFHVWGDGHQRELVESLTALQENLHYHGWLDYAELPLVFGALDVIYYGLRSDYPGAIYNAPNTLAQAMAAGRPVLASDVGDLGRMVRQAECGLLLADASSESLAEAIDGLRDREVRERLGGNGRTAAVAEYNAAHVQARLAALYDTLLTEL
jgi:glycosyltransferase involved in cell wall biosynthesis